ncbi:24743_t:CDS:2, partial [Entrophospora sp. SA101]
MTKITVNDFPEFDKKLNELLERKPPGTSASKIKDLTKVALSSPKQYKNIVYSIQKFIQRCPSDYKLGALYVLDSISQTAQKQKGSAMTKKNESSSITSKASSSSLWTGIEYIDRFEKLLEEIFTHIMQCPEHDKDKVKRVLDLWYDKETYNKEIIQRIKDIYFNQITPLTQLVNSVNETKSVNVSSSNNDPNNMDSSTLLATLNNLTQGALNIPSFLSSNPIPNATIPFNNLPVNSNQPPHPHAIPPHQTPQQPPLTSYVTNFAPKLNNPLDFDYGDMDESDGTPPRSSNQQHKKEHTMKQSPTDPTWNSNGTQQNLTQPVPWNPNTPLPPHQFAVAQQPNGPFVPAPTTSSQPLPLGYSPPSTIPGHPLPSSATHQLLPKVSTSSSAVNNAATTNTTGAGGINLSQQQPGQISAPINPVTTIAPDPTVGMEYIKVLSRTLYVGSVSEDMPKNAMQEMFTKFGPVSVVTIRWALGFGPKDCFDYMNGESLIPITKLTETDKKWLVTSKQGGTGGRPVVGGVVVEEPDIVVGEGLSCGSINKKMGYLFDNSKNDRIMFEKDEE